MKLSLVYVVQDNLSDLKQHLSHNLSQLRGKFDLDCMIIDDGSVENIKQYIRLHFPDVRFLRNTFQEGFNESLIKGLNGINSDYVLVLDPAIRIDYCNLYKICLDMKANGYFSTILPVNTHAANVPFFYHLLFKQGRLQIKHLLKKNVISDVAYVAISEAMIFDVKKYQLLKGINSTFFTPLYAFFDVIFHASKLNWKSIKLFDCSLTKLTSTKGFYSQIHLQDDVLRDEFSFIWLNIRSLRFLVTHFLSLFNVLFSFKVKHLKAFLVQAVMWPFIKKKRLSPIWSYHKDRDLLLQGKI
tara:strand:- start:1567 stop:2463 length:897 start_codon:yes stop_codon:yes gene_type:complete